MRPGSRRNQHGKKKSHIAGVPLFLVVVLVVIVIFIEVVVVKVFIVEIFVVEVFVVVQIVLVVVEIFIVKIFIVEIVVLEVVVVQIVLVEVVVFRRLPLLRGAFRAFLLVVFILVLAVPSVPSSSSGLAFLAAKIDRSSTASCHQGISSPSPASDDFKSVPTSIPCSSKLENRLAGEPARRETKRRII